jgi:hypothetical protein
MRVVMSQLFRPRLLLLPLVLGVLVAPTFLVGSAAAPAAPAGSSDSVCTNVARPVENPHREYPTPDPRHHAPTCVNCRAPLLNAPLARTDSEPRADPVEPPPAA